MGQGAVGDFQVVLAFRLQYPDAADVARVAPDQEGGQAVAPRNPRLERVGIVVNVVDDEAGSRQRAADHRQEIDQKRRRAGDDGRCADTRHRLGPARGRRLEQAVMHRAVIGADRQCESALQLAQRQDGLVLGVVLPALAGIGEGRPRQLVMDHLHRRADDPLHDAAVVRLPGRAVVQLDAMLLAASAQGLALELGRVIQIEPLGLTAHRPVHLHVQPLQPGTLVAGDMREAQADRDGGWGFQRDHHAEHTAGEGVDSDGQVRTANRLSVALVHDDQVDDRVVDLHLFQRRGHGGWHAAGTLQAAGRLLTFSAAHGSHRVEVGDPPSHGIARRYPKLLRFARLCDLAVERRQAALLLDQEALLQQLADDAFDRFRETPLAFPAAGSAGSQVRQETSALPGTVDQDIHLSPGQAQRLSGGVSSLMPHHH